MPRSAALAIAAHPDDIEFGMAGTLLLLKERGWNIHYFNLSSGNCGSVRHDAAQTRKLRLAEAKRAAARLGAVFYPPIAEDLEIIYSVKLVRRVAAVVRDAQPTIVLTHSPQDYMEDHTETARLAVTAAFARGMPNFVTSPIRHSFDRPVTVYHAMPHGLRDGMRQPIKPELFVNTASVHETKLAALAEHKSQGEWLDVSQGMDSYLDSMNEMSQLLGRMSGQFQHAEGWRRHSHLGFCAETADPLREALGAQALVPRPR